jgi:hypothetical protein
VKAVDERSSSTPIPNVAAEDADRDPDGGQRRRPRARRERIADDQRGVRTGGRDEEGGQRDPRDQPAIDLHLLLGGRFRAREEPDDVGVVLGCVDIVETIERRHDIDQLRPAIK